MNPKHKMEWPASPEMKAVEGGLAGATVAGSGALPTQVGPYRVLGPLGAGGMGVVLRARHGEPGWARRQGGDVALKVMHPHLSADPMLRERFLDEAATGLRLEHPGLARVHEVVVEGPWLGMAMELVEGLTLEEWASGPTPAAVVLQVLKPLASALDHLHGRSVIHRDVKPANIKLRPTGQPVLLDLGVSRDAYRQSGVETTVEMAVGTRWWMSPEQEQGRECSARSDVYSLGLLTYWLLSGRMPWAARSPDGAVAVHKALGHLVKLEGGASVVAVVMRAISALVTDRPESCGAFVTALEEAVASDEALRRSADFARSESARGQLGAYESFGLGGGQLVLRRIGPQRFEMGSSEDDEDAYDDERPKHWVTLTRGFSMGVYPVTQGQYEAVMEEISSEHCEGDAAAQRPVESVSWFDAVRFCNKLSVLQGLRPAYTIGPGEEPEVSCDWTSPGFRLPTEAEWECAARAGTGDSLAYSGGETPDEVAWMDENSDSETRPVGLLRPNAWGLYDMSGNVWEWVWDWGIDRYEEGSVTDPLGPTDGSVRVYRGGSWFNSAAYARVAYRSDGGPAFRFNALGFRLARTIP